LGSFLSPSTDVTVFGYERKGPTSRSPPLPNIYLPLNAETFRYSGHCLTGFFPPLLPHPLMVFWNFKTILILSCSPFPPPCVDCSFSTLVRPVDGPPHAPPEGLLRCLEMALSAFVPCPLVSDLKKHAINCLEDSARGVKDLRVIPGNCLNQYVATYLKRGG